MLTNESLQILMFTQRNGDKEMMTIEPYEHNCDQCEWVGWYYHPGSDLPANVYLCKSTVVIRFSDDPADFWSNSAGVAAKSGISYLNEEMFERHTKAIQERKRLQEMEVDVKKRYWLGEIKECDICGRSFADSPEKDGEIVFIDGKTKSGSWANMCISCFRDNGVGLGIGRGQVYELQRNGKDKGRWLKIA